MEFQIPNSKLQFILYFHFNFFIPFLFYSISCRWCRVHAATISVTKQSTWALINSYLELRIYILYTVKFISFPHLFTCGEVSRSCRANEFKWKLKHSQHYKTQIGEGKQIRLIIIINQHYYSKYQILLALGYCPSFSQLTYFVDKRKIYRRNKTSNSSLVA